MAQWLAGEVELSWVVGLLNTHGEGVRQERRSDPGAQDGYHPQTEGYPP